MTTIEFLPERLNRAPVVFRGLTTFEMFLAMGAGAIGGLLMGIPVTMLLGSWAAAPIGALTGAMGLLLLAGKVLARYKRGRSDTWFYRMVEMKVSRSALGPLLAATGLANRSLILRCSYWAVRRRRP